MTMHFTGKGGYCLQRQFAALAIREVFILEEEAVQSHQGRKWKISKLIFAMPSSALYLVLIASTSTMT